MSDERRGEAWSVDWIPVPHWSQSERFWSEAIIDGMERKAGTQKKRMYIMIELPWIGNVAQGVCTGGAPGVKERRSRRRQRRKKCSQDRPSSNLMFLVFIFSPHLSVSFLTISHHVEGYPILLFANPSFPLRYPRISISASDHTASVAWISGVLGERQNGNDYCKEGRYCPCNPKWRSRSPHPRYYFMCIEVQRVCLSVRRCVCEF